MKEIIKVAVIVAGGSGSRMGIAKPKQTLEIQGKSIITHTIEKFLDAFADISIILVLSKAIINTSQDYIPAYSNHPQIRIIEGGANRFDSVKNGINAAPENAVIFVHDAVRCLLTKDLIINCYNAALQFGSAIPVIPMSDSLRIIHQDGTNKIVDRSNIVAVQTPQTFQSHIIKKAFLQEFNPSFTDEASVVEAMGESVNLIQGEATNIKITTPIDLSVAEQILAARSKT